MRSQHRNLQRFCTHKCTHILDALSVSHHLGANTQRMGTSKHRDVSEMQAMCLNDF